MQWSAVHHPSLSTYIATLNRVSMSLHITTAPHGPPPLVPGKRQQKGESSHSKHSIIDQQTCLEAWNWYTSARIAYDPDIALSLVKYQTLMAMLFRQYTPKACIEYDCLFHQAAGQDAYLPWDCLNNQIFVHTFTPAHAHPWGLWPNFPLSWCHTAVNCKEITPFVSTVPSQLLPISHRPPHSGICPAAGRRPPTTHIPPWPTTKTNSFQQCHPWCIRHWNLQAIQCQANTNPSLTPRQQDRKQ